MSDKEIEQVKEKEGQRLLNKIKPQATVITLEIKGKMLSSEGLAKELQTRMTQGQKRLYICHRWLQWFTPRRLTTQQLCFIIQQYDLPTK